MDNPFFHGILQTMAVLTPEEILEFKKITKEVKGLDLADEQAIENGTRLIYLAELLIFYEKYGNLSEKAVEPEEKPEDSDHLNRLKRSELNSLTSSKYFRRFRS